MLSDWSGKNWIGGRLPWKKFDVWRSGGRIVDFEILKVFKIFKIFNGCQENQSWPCNPTLGWFSFLGWGLRWRWRWGSISTFNLKTIWRAKWKLTANWNEFDCKDAYWSTHSNCNPILEPKYQKSCSTQDYHLQKTTIEWRKRKTFILSIFFSHIGASLEVMVAVIICFLSTYTAASRKFLPATAKSSAISKL